MNKPADRVLPNVWCGRHGHGFVARLGRTHVAYDRGLSYRKFTLTRIRKADR